ncbi:MAG: DNA cytosine methyltransferase, partial [Caulobacteraceae bacterium]|nr:DNA cytosine methyltransferase [Caulobacteraceae bacterium]
MLTYLAIAERLKPRWLVWENVPGVLSSNGGKDFGSFLGALGELGYEWAYRVLDAQWFGVAQRRRRVFVVAHLGKGNLAAKVLFESESVRRNPAPSRETRQGVAANVEAGAGNIDQRIDACIPDVCATIDCGLSKQVGKQLTQQAESFYFPIPIHDQATRHAGKHGDKQDGKGNGLGVGKPGDPCPTLTKGDKHAVLYENHPNDSRVTGPHDVAPSCVSRYGTGGGNVPLVQEAVAVDTYNHALQEKAVPIRSTASDICHTGGVINPADRMAVRRLTPRECERLQGFNDDHTLIPWRNKSTSE